MGADCIKVERPGVGDITRGQLRDVKGADSLYFTMLNGNKRSITIDSKHAKGKEILERLIRRCDVLVENFAPGALDRMGLTWDYIHKTNPRMIVASVKGFGPGPTRTARSTRTSRNAPAARPRPPASAKARRSSPARRSATAAPACIWRSAFAPRSISAPAPGAARRCSRRCRTACSTSRA